MLVADIDWAQVIDAAGRFLTTLTTTFGPGGTVGIIVSGVALAVGWRVYSDYRADKASDRALAEKDKSIERIANVEKEWRIYFMMKDGWNSADIQRFIVNGEPPPEPKPVQQQDPPKQLPSPANEQRPHGDGATKRKDANRKGKR